MGFGMENDFFIVFTMPTSSIYKIDSHLVILIRIVGSIPSEFDACTKIQKNILNLEYFIKYTESDIFQKYTHDTTIISVAHPHTFMSL